MLHVIIRASGDSGDRNQNESKFITVGSRGPELFAKRDKNKFTRSIRIWTKIVL